MIYTTSDLHGISVEKFKKLLSTARFGEDDFLYILGDVIDRGQYGIELLKYIMAQANMELLLGNHEAMMLSCSFLLDEITDESIDSFDDEKIKLLMTWMSNGGSSTIEALRSLNAKSPEEVRDILEFLSDAPVFEAVSAGDRDFILTHSGFGNFREDKKISEYTSDELLWNRPNLSDRYFDDIVTVFGHTPTGYIDESYRGRIIKTDTWIDIDTSLVSGASPCLLRLDDLKEFYLNKT